MTKQSPEFGICLANHLTDLEITTTTSNLGSTHWIAVELSIPSCGRRLVASEGPVEAPVAVVLPAALGDECVGVDSLAGAAVLGRHRCALSQQRLLVVLLQVGRLQRLAQGQLLRMPYPELLAERDAGTKRPDGEVDVAVDVSQVWQLDAERLVHRGEVDDGVGRDVVLV